MPASRLGTHRGPRVLLVAGEASGDGYGAQLVRALRARAPSVTLFGMGGQAMRRAGVHLIYDVTGRGTVGFVESLRQAPLFRRVLGRLVEAARRLRPDVAVFIDFPGFNLRLGPAMRRLGIPVVYYIAPAIWAWGAGRARTVASFASHVVCAFDFEVPLYRGAGAKAEWLGHPILDDVPERPAREQAAAEMGFGPGEPVVALLPGSRLQEIQRLYPVMLEAARLIREKVEGVRFVASVAPGIEPRLLEDASGEMGGALPVRMVGGGIWRALGAANFAVVAAGTATLQTALWQVPMLVVYKISEPTYQMARRLVRVPYIALPNVVAGRQVVEELIQHAAQPDRIARAVVEHLSDPGRAVRAQAILGEIRSRLGEPGASMRAAARILEAARR